MNKLQKNLMLLLGILMCVVAATMVLELVNLSITDFLFPVAGISLLVYDRFTGSPLARNVGLVLLLPGCGYAILKISPALSGYAWVVYAIALLVLFVVFYILYRKNIFAVLSILDFIGICAVMAEKVSDNLYEMYGYVFMAISAILLVVYFIKRTKIGVLPILFAVFSYLCGLVNFLTSAKVINYTVHSVSLAGILLVTGLTVIIYSIHKSKDKED